MTRMPRPHFPKQITKALRTLKVFGKKRSEPLRLVSQPMPALIGQFAAFDFDTPKGQRPLLVCGLLTERIKPIVVIHWLASPAR
jgi:hypothetical protein